MKILKAGFARVDVTPPLGIEMVGYLKPRYAEGILDELKISALALSCGAERVVFLSFDTCMINVSAAARYKKRVSEVTGLREEAVFVHATHTHTGPVLGSKDSAGIKDSDVVESKEEQYGDWVCHKMADAAMLALNDLKEAKMGWGVGKAPNVAFIRRFHMKDGTIRTNPGVNNPNIKEPIGEVDERVNVLRFDREGAETIVLVNFGNHPDTVGGNMISGDWPRLLCETVEKALDHTKCIFFNGAQGDVNHVNVHPTGGFLNDTFHDFDDVSRGYGHARYIGHAVAGAVLQVYDKVKYADVESLRYLQHRIRVPSNMPKPEEMPEARRIIALHEAGRDNELPYTGMMLTTVVADAKRKLLMEGGPEFFEMDLCGVAIGDVVLIGIPGEAFTEIGRGLKATKEWELVLPVCLMNGYCGYFPTKEAYDEGGYEARCSRYGVGVAETIIDEGKQLMTELR